MKNKRIKSIIVLIAVIVIAVLLCLFQQYKGELLSRFSDYHNAGEIFVTLNGERIELDNIELNFECDCSESPIITKINDNRFKIEEGVYGPNYFSFDIPTELFPRLAVRFGQFNTNWWHVADYKIEIDLTENTNSTITAVIKQELSLLNGGQESYVQTQTLNLGESEELRIN